MHRILAVAKREYMARLRTKTFLVGTIMMPLLMVAWIAAPEYFASRARAHDVLVLDQSGDPGLFAAMQGRLQKATRDTGREARRRPLSALFSLEHRARTGARVEGNLVTTRPQRVGDPHERVDVPDERPDGVQETRHQRARPGWVSCRSNEPK